MARCCHSTPISGSGRAARCPYQIKIQSALSIWLIGAERRHGNLETLGRRLYIQAAEPMTRCVNQP